jgi:hypothetical protein
MDVDYFFPNGAPDSLVSKYSGFPKPAGFKNCQCEKEDDPINSGFFIFRPNQTMLSDMIANFDKIQSYNDGDQGFIDQYFRTRRQGFEYIPADHKKFTTNFGRKGPVPQNYTGIHIFVSVILVVSMVFTPSLHYFLTKADSLKIGFEALELSQREPLLLF